VKLLALAAGFGLALAACGGTSASRSSATTSAPTPSTSAATHSTNSTTATTTNPLPTLGLTGAWFGGAGFGQVEPGEVFLGGDPTGLVTSIRWRSWGGSEAEGTGTSTYVAANQTTADGSQQTATIVAFDVGTCAGHAAYQEVEWYFPSEGGTFDPSQAVYACKKGYVNPNE
jgi:hypothetical protein